MGSSALYFDIFKDCTFAYLIYNTLYDMSKGNMFSKEVEFEAVLTITIILSIVVVQVRPYYYKFKGFICTVCPRRIDTQSKICFY